MRKFVSEWSLDVFTVVAFIATVWTQSIACLGLFALLIVLYFQNRWFVHVENVREIEFEHENRKRDVALELDKLKASSVNATQIDELKSRLTKLELVLNLKPLNMSKQP